MRAAAIRDDVTLKTMSDDGQRNTMITEVTAQLGLSGFGLQAFNNRQIVERSLAHRHGRVSRSVSGSS